LRVCLFILGNGRDGYLERTIDSWEANVVGNITHKIIFDDSGNTEYQAWLEERFGDRFTIVPVADTNVGQVEAIKFVFNYIKNLDIDYVLELEEDWMLFRELNLDNIISVMEKNSNILQMRIPRTIWHSEYHNIDLVAGSLLRHHKNIPDTRSRYVGKGNKRWFLWRGMFYFWSHNPSLYKKSMVYEEYLEHEVDHEYHFGADLFSKYPRGVVGFWAKNDYDAYITHIGIRDDNLVNLISKSPIEKASPQIEDLPDLIEDSTSLE
jgi:hypothetical protein